MAGRIQVPQHEPADSIFLLSGAELALEETRLELSPGVTLGKVDANLFRAVVPANSPEVERLSRTSTIFIKAAGTTSTEDLLRPEAVLSTLLLCSRARIVKDASIICRENRAGDPLDATVTRPPIHGEILWGHFHEGITRDDIEQAKVIWPRVSAIQVPESFRRVSNALLFYFDGLHSNNPDLALIAFATCLESLFSTGEQEISFKLSLRLATFLSDENANRAALFEDCREVYRIRSRVVHGEAIRRNSEAAAIYLVEGIVPMAEELARKSLLKILEMQLEGLFDKAAKVDTLFDKLLFGQSVRDALDEIDL